MADIRKAAEMALDALPPMPKPYATSVAWLNGDGGCWQQWHGGDDDPMPNEWDDRPPDEIVHVFTAEQMRAYAIAALSQPAEGQEPQGWRDGVNAAALVLEKKADEYAGRFGALDPDTGAFEFKREAQLEYHSTLVELADEIRALLAAAPQPQPQAEALTYSSTQATKCAGCGEHKHTPLRIDAMGGYVCLACIDKKLGSLLGEFGYPQAEARGDEPVAWREAVATAYGHLWHVNNEPVAPIPLYSPEKAAYEARKALRGLLTSEQRGEAINKVGAQLGVYSGDDSSPAPSAPQAGEAPSVEAAREMGAKGAPAVEAERLAFEAWMAGHCWALSATWDGKQYKSDAEAGGDLDPRAMATRRLWAAWRDSAALAAQPVGREALKFRIERPDDENVEFWLGNNMIGSANHDDHGRSGMRDMEALFTQFAAAVGITGEGV